MNVSANDYTSTAGYFKTLLIYMFDRTQINQSVNFQDGKNTEHFYKMWTLKSVKQKKIPSWSYLFITQSL